MTHFKRLLGVLVIGLGLAEPACGQTAPSGRLSGALRDQVQAGRFDAVTSIRGLPLGVRGELTKLFGSGGLDIVDPGASFQTSTAAGAGLPTRRLVAAGCTIEYCLVYYERGVPAHTWHVALFHWTPEATRLEWGGVAPAGLATFDDVRKAVLSGAVTGPGADW